MTRPEESSLSITSWQPMSLFECRYTIAHRKSPVFSAVCTVVTSERVASPELGEGFEKIAVRVHQEAYGKSDDIEESYCR